MYYPARGYARDPFEFQQARSECHAKRARYMNVQVSASHRAGLSGYGRTRRLVASVTLKLCNNIGIHRVSSGTIIRTPMLTLCSSPQAGRDALLAQPGKRRAVCCLELCWHPLMRINKQGNFRAVGEAKFRSLASAAPQVPRDAQRDKLK